VAEELIRAAARDSESARPNCCRDLLSERNRNLSITQIEFGWGFNSPSHFSYPFRQYYNVPDSVYRRRHTGSERVLQPLIPRRRASTPTPDCNAGGDSLNGNFATCTQGAGAAFSHRRNTSGRE
jgi:hypothetical protein